MPGGGGKAPEAPEPSLRVVGWNGAFQEEGMRCGLDRRSASRSKTATRKPAATLHPLRPVHESTFRAVQAECPGHFNELIAGHSPQCGVSTLGPT